MFRSWKMKNALKKGFDSINIPDKEKVLPVQALDTQKYKIKNHKVNVIPAHAIIQMKSSRYKTALAGFTSIILFVLAITIFITGISFKSSKANPSSVLSNQTNNSEDIINNVSGIPEKKVVISADISDNNTIVSNEGMLHNNEIHISDMLKEKMEQYKGQDVLFRVMVEIQVTFEEERNFIENILYKSKDYNIEINAIKKLREEVEGYKRYTELYEKYWNYIIDVKEEKIKVSPELDNAKKELERLQPYYDKAHELYLQISSIENKCVSKYRKLILNEKINFAKNLGASGIKPVTETSDIVSALGYYMELSEKAITSMSERGGYIFKFALPERNPAYDRRISDSLSALMDHSKNNEEIHVAVISVLDKCNYFAWMRGISNNQRYNSDLNKEWFDNLELNNNNVSNFISNILKRNNITDKRVYNEKLSDYQVNFIGTDSVYIGAAGFEVKLTKEQIIKLSEDSDVKVIYPMNSGYDRYFEIRND